MRYLIAAIILLLGSAAVVRAQSFPGDNGAGTRLGMQQMRQSGEVGSVTLFRRGPNATLVVLDVQSVPGTPQPASIQRNQGCDGSPIDPRPAFKLHDLVKAGPSGHSATVVNASEDKLLSGNYSTIVHANRADPTWYVSCGHLYR